MPAAISVKCSCLSSKCELVICLTVSCMKIEGFRSHYWLLTVLLSNVVCREKLVHIFLLFIMWQTFAADLNNWMITDILFMHFICLKLNSPSSRSSLTFAWDDCFVFAVGSCSL